MVARTAAGNQAIHGLFFAPLIHVQLVVNAEQARQSDEPRLHFVKWMPEKNSSGNESSFRVGTATELHY